MLIDTETVATGVAGLGGVTLAGRWFFSWWSKQSHADNLDKRQSDWADRLEKQNLEHVKTLDEIRAQNAKLERQNAELHAQTQLMRAQAQMMYRMLEGMGVPDTQLKIFEWLMIEDHDDGQA